MSLEGIIGEMFAGKTTELFRRLDKVAICDLKVAYITHERDDRGGLFYSHNPNISNSHPGIDFLKLKNLGDFDPTKYDYIGVDEAQFFPDLNKIVREWIIDKEKDVVIAGLKGDYELNTIGQIPMLLPIFRPGGLDILGATCNKCVKQGKTPRNAIAGHSFANKHIDNQILIGGSETYEARCLSHYKQGASAS